jgi:hypothetical protein
MQSSQKIAEIAIKKNQSLEANDAYIRPFDRSVMELQNYLEEIKQNKGQKSFEVHEQVIYGLNYRNGGMPQKAVG